MIKCCVFDLDGTVADTVNTIAYYGNFALEHFGLPAIPVEKYKYFAGDGYIKLLQRMLDEVGADASNFDEIAAFYHDEYEKDSMYLTKAFDGMTELLNSLKSKGIKLAVLSNKPHGAAEDVAKALYGDVFDLCYGAGEGIPLKPEPAMLFNILREFGAKPEECVYVGDTSVDMITGKAAGAFTVGVLWGFRKKEELEKYGADLIVSSPDEILKYIESV